MLDSETSEQKAMDSMREHFRKVHQKKNVLRRLLPGLWLVEFTGYQLNH